MTVIWCMVPQIWSAIDRIFCHFGQYFAHLPPKNPKNQNFEKMKKLPGDIVILQKCTKNHDHMLYYSWDMVHDGCNLFFILGHFLPFYPLNNPKNQNFQKMKKIPRDIIILHMCTKNYDQMMYGSWDMVHDRGTDGLTDRRMEGWKKWHIRGGCPT